MPIFFSACNTRIRDWISRHCCSVLVTYLLPEISICLHKRRLPLPLMAPLRLYGHHESPPPPLTNSSTSTSESSFTDPTAPMPQPGPAHYEARRSWWLTPPRIHTATTSMSPSTSRAKLEALLSREGSSPGDDDAVWNAGLRSVWKGLVGGGRLRRRLPLAMVVRATYASLSTRCC